MLVAARAFFCQLPGFMRCLEKHITIRLLNKVVQMESSIYAAGLVRLVANFSPFQDRDNPPADEYQFLYVAITLSWRKIYFKLMPFGEEPSDVTCKVNLALLSAQSGANRAGQSAPQYPCRQGRQ